MIIHNIQEFIVDGLPICIRPAESEDAAALSPLRVQIDGETENMDREPGEAFLDVPAFERIIEADAANPRNLFLVAVAGGRIAGYARCEGSDLKRLAHKVEFGVCVAKEFWGYGIGKQLLMQAIQWADANGIVKMTLQVLETNEKAIRLYQSFGFEIEGVLRKDKLLADGKYYSTLVMGRLRD